jgi:hypothetical protein
MRAIASAGGGTHRRVRREVALHGGGKEGCGRTFARDIAERKAEALLTDVDVVEEIASHRAARD